MDKTLEELKDNNKKLELSLKDSESVRKDMISYMEDTEKNILNFELRINNMVDNLSNKIKQFITFYAQVGLHVKELCDGKK